jgi:hypothetical protein
MIARRLPDGKGQLFLELKRAMYVRVNILKRGLDRLRKPE